MGVRSKNGTLAPITIVLTFNQIDNDFCASDIQINICPYLVPQLVRDYVHFWYKNCFCLVVLKNNQLTLNTSSSES